MISDDKALVTEFSQAEPVLDSISWDFSTPFTVGRSETDLFDARKHHWYPATFIPEIPYTLTEVLTRPGALVYDPFAGIGTAVFQALLLGRRPFATELSSIAVEIIRSMCVLLGSQTRLFRLNSFAQNLRSDYRSEIDYSNEISDCKAEFERLRPWYSKETFHQLRYLAAVEARCTDTQTSAAMRVAVSAALKAVSAQDRGWGCIADNVKPDDKQRAEPKDAIRQVQRNIGVMVKDLREARGNLPPLSRRFLQENDVCTYIKRADVRTCVHISERSADLIVTSPPYPNMTDYSYSQRLSYYWLGRDPADEVVDEIGARRKRSRNSAVREYMEEMMAAMRRVCSTLKTGGYLCLVLPIFRGERHNNIERKQAIEDLVTRLEDDGLVRKTILARHLPDRRRHHNQAWTSLEQERIYVFRRERCATQE